MSDKLWSAYEFDIMLKFAQISVISGRYYTLSDTNPINDPECVQKL